MRGIFPIPKRDFEMLFDASVSDDVLECHPEERSDEGSVFTQGTNIHASRCKSKADPSPAFIYESFVKVAVNHILVLSDGLKHTFTYRP